MVEFKENGLLLLNPGHSEVKLAVFCQRVGVNICQDASWFYTSARRKG